MTEEQYQKLRSVIIEANPSIKDLVFGCEVEFQTARCDFVCRNYAGNPIISFGFMTKVVKEKDLKIIGRPTRLADVLMALPEVSMEGDYSCIMYHFPESKNEVAFTFDDGDIIWNCKEDNLDNQPEETKQFLYKLLVKSNHED